MPTKRDLYNCDVKMRRERSLIERTPTSERNKVSLRGYFEHFIARNLSTVRVLKLSCHARHLALMLGKDFAAAMREDLIALVARINSRTDYTTWTKSDYRVALRQVYHFLAGTPEMPDIVSWIKTMPMRSELRTLEESDLLSSDELARLLDAAGTPMERAFVSVLAETGARIGELLTLDRKGVVFQDDVAYLHVNGKTGPRQVPITWSAKALHFYMEAVQGEPDTPLWRSSAKAIKPFLEYWTARKMLQRLRREAGVTKKVNPHHWRHSRVTLDAKNGMERFQMCAYFGWRFTSHMPDTYIHLSARNLEPLIRRLHTPPGQEVSPARSGTPATGLLEGLRQLTQARASQASLSVSPASQPETRPSGEATAASSGEPELLTLLLQNPETRTALVKALLSTSLPPQERA